MREYSKLDITVANLPYLGMMILGSLTIAYAGELSALRVVSAGAYFIYGILGALWIMVFVCPYCHYYNTKGCPCGYGVISARIVKKGTYDCFAQKFKQHIPVIAPLWIIPVIFSGVDLYRTFSWMILGLMLVFIIESWIILPIVSKRHACIECPQKDQCPWMGKEAKGD